MDSTDRKGSSGQTMVQVAMLMVVFIAFLVLAIDMGHIYNERRRMQNAADAAALAGAWEICLGDPALAVPTAWEYAVDRNGADVADVSVGNHKITVFARETIPLNIAQFFGIHTAEISARAVAACGVAVSACGLWPVAFPRDEWKQLAGGFDEVPCKENRVFYVWTGDHENQSPDCVNVHDCDLDGDGIDDVVDIWGRAFLDFGNEPHPDYPDDCRQSGCGESELSCQISSESGGITTIPACIPGTSGVKAGTKLDVDERAAVDPTVGIPIYEGLGCPPDVEYCHGGQTYDVRHIRCVDVVGWVHSLEVPRQDGANPPWKDKVIEVVPNCDPKACVTSCGGTHGELPDHWEMTAVSLIE
jgi:hypothetical protein